MDRSPGTSWHFLGMVEWIDAGHRADRIGAPEGSWGLATKVQIDPSADGSLHPRMNDG